MNAQTLYDIEIEYIRSVHFESDTTCDSHLRLTWAHSSSSYQESISEFELDMDSSFGVEGYHIGINVRTVFREARLILALKPHKR